MASEAVGSVLGNKESLKKVCLEAMKAFDKPLNKPFKVLKNIESHVIFVFRGTWDLNDWYSETENPFGATKINQNLFPSLRRIGSDEAAVVNKAFQASFESILTQLQEEVNKVNDKKPIVFAGHSSGGPMAVLATIWFLENKARQKDPLCVTFGSPLVGNHIFSHALRRENWARHFIHFVTRHDIVPRLFFAPRTAASEQHFQSLLESIPPKKPKQGSSHRKTPALDGLFMHVIESALTLTSHVATKLMDSSNPLMETMTSFIDLSPYRPFGNYVFVSESENFVLLNNSEAVLQFLFFSCQPSDTEEAEGFAKKIVTDHFAYSDRLLAIDRRNIYGETGDDDDVRIHDVIENSDQFGLSQRGKLHLLAAGESEKQKRKNLEKIELKKASIKEEMEKIENYKKTCRQRKILYFDSFKQQKREDDFNANVSRLAQAGIWDEILEMLKSNKLPDNFESIEDWIDRGTRYRRLVEPLDIANYYRHLKNEDTGNYMGAPGMNRVPRPKRYSFPQKWLEHAKKLKKDSCGQSNFWAELEELSRGNSHNIENFNDRAIKLQRNLLDWNQETEKYKKIDDDVFLSDSTFVKWWTSLEAGNKVEGIEQLVINE